MGMLAKLSTTEGTMLCAYFLVNGHLLFDIEIGNPAR
jgi:hypothetical protein